MMKTMIITGGGSGLGKEIAFLLAKQDYHVLLTGRNLEKLSATQKDIENFGGKADVSQLDVTDPQNVQSLLASASSLYDIQGIVNNAGVGYFGPFTDIANNQITNMIETNVLGTIYTTKAILPFLTSKGRGHIINIISTAGLRGKVNEAVYVASKFAVRGFTESLQKEYENTGIHFTSVYMGGMDTPFWENSDHIADPSRLRAPCEIAEIIINNLEKHEIIIENKKS
ncbi:SDR family NAD(P)-dependent oxidoreductase [Bacillus sp. cl95]|uniref:SDR family NAD(P)-dependent oxidoreductase n=2 Tax=unclassified Bacillus (in: firmicutes) TaxID=185979 RepID=UPI0034A2381A